MIFFPSNQAFSAKSFEQLKAEVKQRYPKVRTISSEELLRRIEADRSPLLIDARSREEFMVSSLPGARHAESPKEVDEILEFGGYNKSTEIVVYCSIGFRSSKLASKLAKRGYKKVYNLEGSIFEWANKGYRVYRDDNPVSEVHPFNKRWGYYLNPELHPRFLP